MIRIDLSSDVDVVICFTERLLQPGHWRLSQCPLITRDSKSWAQTESWESQKKERENRGVLAPAPPGQYCQRLHWARPGGAGVPFFHRHWTPDRPASVTFFPWLCELQSPPWSREANTSLCPLISSLHLASHRPLATRSPPCLRKVAASSAPGCFHSFTPSRLSWHTAV